MQLSSSRVRPAFFINGVSLLPSVFPIGFIIRRIREIHGMTQGDVALMSEANLSYISTIESGVNNISIRKLLLICNALRISPVMLMGIWQNVTASVPDGLAIRDSAL
jgi:transcriptional regulator with XRE-family HTH domain